MKSVSPHHADALQAVLAAPDARVIVVGGAEPAGLAVFERTGGGLAPRAEIAGSEGLVRAARRLALALGVETTDPFASLDRLAAGGDAGYQDALASALRWKDAGGSIEANEDDLRDVLTRVAGDQATSLRDGDSLNARVQALRRDLAASFASQLAGVVGAALAQARSGKAGGAAAGGGLFAAPRFATELGRIAVELSIAPVPESVGRAVGAAVVDSRSTDRRAAGPSFSEEDVKRTLDNCRLDYVYEPDWARLMDRVSRMLAQGKVVGWFQGPMAFGPRPLGTRSILADPSSRYVRQNVNEYLRLRPLDEPLPIALAPSASEACLVGGAGFTGPRDAVVAPAWRPRLAGALSARFEARIQSGGGSLEPRLAELLERHLAATGTPGLVEVCLAGPGEPIACTPRDAVRTVYSSAIDALVIGRFLLMKDYWLLRTEDR